MLHDRASGTTAPVGPPGGRDPALSADGRTLAVVTDSGLHLVDRAAGTARQVVAGSIETRCCPAMAPVSVLGDAAGPPDLSGDGRFVVFPRR